MADIVTRSGKGSPLDNNEMDANLTNLNNYKAEQSDLDNIISLIPTNNIVVIKSVEDFPSPVGGVIYLENKSYRIDGAIVSPYVFNIPSGYQCFIFGSQAFVDNILYTGSGTMFTSVDVGVFHLESVGIYCDNGTVFDIQSTVVDTGNMYFFDSFIIGADSLGVIKNLLVFAIRGSGWLSVNQGIILDSIALLVIQFSQIQSWRNTGGTMMTFQGELDYVLLSVIAFNAESTEYIFDIKQTAVIRNMIVNACSNDRISTGSVFALNSQTSQDSNMVWSGNSVIPNSSVSGMMYLSGNSTVTPITTIGSAVKIVATTYQFVSNVTERILFDNTGRATYKGSDDMNISIHAVLNVQPSTGEDSISVIVAKNGVVDSSTKSTTIAKAGSQITVFGVVHMIKDDYLELYIQNNDTTVDILATDVTMKIG